MKDIFIVQNVNDQGCADVSSQMTDKEPLSFRSTWKSNRAINRRLSLGNRIIRENSVPGNARIGGFGKAAKI